MYRETPGEALVYLGFRGRVFAFFKESGVVAWRAELGSDGEVCLHVGEDTLWAACSESVLAIDPRSGAVRWRAELPFRVTQNVLMLVDTDAIFLSSGGEIACVGHDGTVRWSDPLQGTGFGPPTLAIRGRAVKLESKD